MLSIALVSLSTEGHGMNANEKKADRAVRIVALAIGLIGWCPAYSLPGTNTCAAGSKTT